MKPAVELNELIERIQHAANRENGLSGGQAKERAAEDWPPVAEPFPPPPSPAPPVADAGESMRAESLLDQAASLLRGARAKTSVSKKVPRWLHPLFRNQGGYNGVLLAAAERLLEVSRSRRQESFDLHERLLDFQAWARSVAEISAENRAWMQAADTRLQTWGEERRSSLAGRTDPPEEASGRGRSEHAQNDPGANPATIDAEQLARLTAHIEAMEADRRVLNDHLQRLRAQINEQADYIRTVHHHLDQLGAHVDTTLARRDRSA